MPDVDVGSADCSSKSKPSDVDVTGSASDTYWWASSRVNVMNDLTAQATNDAWRKVNPSPPACQKPCEPFVLYSNYSMTVDVIDWTRFFSGFWAPHYGMRVDVRIRCKMTTGCASY